ncbi:guanine nucleotide exchange protein for ADP-robosylation factor [Orbilia oligospora]|uniref:Guanine nucleotide exchange protein for ADP-robosylation factor n=1 Tax=Orbilia oligospora TaxID=2813651 RepID=A0A7C8V9M9_ORBOL|nr:guanine nucleotide exchange protein for ADP-robosylation factor [Orbilia oligospora]
MSNPDGKPALPEGESINLPIGKASSEEEGPLEPIDDYEEVSIDRDVVDELPRSEHIQQEQVIAKEVTPISDAGETPATFVSEINTIPETSSTPNVVSVEESELTVVEPEPLLETNDVEVPRIDVEEAIAAQGGLAESAPKPAEIKDSDIEEKPTEVLQDEDAQGEPTKPPEIPSSPPPQIVTSSEPSSSQPSSPAARPGSSASSLPARPPNPTPVQAQPIRYNLPNTVFIVQSLETISASRDARRRADLAEAARRALEALKDLAPYAPDPEVVFEPLRLACMTHTTTLVVAALDSIDKLISYGYFTTNHSSISSTPLIERAIDTIASCFIGDVTDDKVQMQIIKALLSAVLNDKFIVHGAGLLKSIRQIYNIFLLSRNAANQTVAQGALTQMVNVVFERMKTRIASREARAELGGLQHQDVGGSTTTVGAAMSTVDGGEGDEESSTGDTQSQVNGSSTQLATPGEKITLQSFEHRKSFDDEKIMDNAPTTVTIGRPQSSSGVGNQIDAQPEVSEQDLEDEIFTKDIFLVFRAMCKLSIKVLPPEQIADLKCHGMRSKLLSLHLILTILKQHCVVFTNPLVTIRGSGTEQPTQFVQAIKQYLCLSLSRNAASSVPWVFEMCGEIFWLVVRDMRSALKKELEVFMKEIYLAIIENKNSSLNQKHSILGLFERISSDPKALVEIYLNYDCDRAALDNLFQRIMEHIAKVAALPVYMNNVQQQAYIDNHPRRGTDGHYHLTHIPPSFAAASIGAAPPPGHQTDGLYPQEYILKRHSIECLVEALRSLVSWAQKGIEATSAQETSRESLDNRDSFEHTPSRGLSGPGTPQLEVDRRVSSNSDLNNLTVFDDPSQFEKSKLRKNALSECVRKFNTKPKHGVKALIELGFIKSKEPRDVAEFLLSYNSILDKGKIGEYLGEGDEENINIMHSFVDLLDFNRMRYVDALRRFLQTFRLPGESQKIDRLMLKFAERYISGNPNAFANADTAYVLAYSVIMLNVDQHSSKIKRRMKKEDFVKNNRGINDGADLPEEYLHGIFEEISQNEIILEDEKDAIRESKEATQKNAGLAAGIGQALATVGRDLQREAYMQASEEMANKTEQLFKTLLRSQRTSSKKTNTTIRFVNASSFKHIGPMFETVWMSFLSGLSGPTQDSQDVESIRLCMEGFKLAIKISCLFDLELPRISFVGALTRFTQLSNLSEMKPKNVEALKVLLDVAQTEGNLLKSSWKDVLLAVSQLERFQLISQGVDEGSLPDMNKSLRATTTGDDRRTSFHSTRSSKSIRHKMSNYSADVAEESRSREVVIAVDKIFANSSKLNGDAIVHFVRALCEVSWQEVQSSGSSESPRMFSLQKLVEISFYNMNRIRFEWSNIWAILGEHFNNVGCLPNTSIVFFALDSLRQLSMRFLEIQELPHFRFQKDFLKPFEHVMANSSHAKVKDMVLQCLNQMLQARGNMIKSGWRTMFGTYSFAAKEQYDNIVEFAFKSVQSIYKERFGVIVAQGAFSDLVVCLTEFAKNLRFQRISLQAIEILKTIVPRMLDTPECPLSPKSADFQHTNGLENGNGIESVMGGGKVKTAKEDPMVKFWFPVLFAFHDVLMTGEDLEVRSRALNHLFDTLVSYGAAYPEAFWDLVCRQLLFPIFMVLKSKSEMSRFNNHEDMTVWLSTTMIQALRNLIQLFTHFFYNLSRMLDGFLELLITCICQENDTIARIGSSCLQQLILQNVKKLQKEHWGKVVGAFVVLFERTTAHQLFSAVNNVSTAVPGGAQGILSAGSMEEEADFNDTTVDTGGLKIDGLETLEQKEAAATLGSETEPEPENTNSNPETPQEQQLEDYRPSQQAPQIAVSVSAARKRYFARIITKCVLQGLMIETVSELFSNDDVYNLIPSPELLRLMSLLKKSFAFARRFNNDKELRMKLFRDGFMKQPPNLLKQESTSAATYISILFRMFADDKSERRESRRDVEEALVPLCIDIIHGYVVLDRETQHRNILAWQPVVVDVMDGYLAFPDADFERNITAFYPVVVELLRQDLSEDMRRSLMGILRRVGEMKLGAKTVESVVNGGGGTAVKGRRRAGSVMSR